MNGPQENEPSPEPWLVHGPGPQRAGWSVGRKVFGQLGATSIQWLTRADGKWRQWRTQGAAQGVADEMNASEI